jgi:hypothetical protein
MRALTSARSAFREGRFVQGVQAGEHEAGFAVAVFDAYRRVVAQPDLVPALRPCSGLAVAARDVADRRSGSRSLRDRYVDASPTAVKMIGIV